MLGFSVGQENIGIMRELFSESRPDCLSILWSHTIDVRNSGFQATYIAFNWIASVRCIVIFSPHPISPPSEAATSASHSLANTPNPALAHSACRTHVYPRLYGCRCGLVRVSSSRVLYAERACNSSSRCWVSGFGRCWRCWGWVLGVGKEFPPGLVRPLAVAVLLSVT